MGCLILYFLRAVDSGFRHKLANEPFDAVVDSLEITVERNLLLVIIF